MPQLYCTYVRGGSYPTNLKGIGMTRTTVEMNCRSASIKSTRQQLSYRVRLPYPRFVLPL